MKNNDNGDTTVLLSFAQKAILIVPNMKKKKEKFSLSDTDQVSL